MYDSIVHLENYIRYKEHLSVSANEAIFLRGTLEDKYYFVTDVINCSNFNL